MARSRKPYADAAPAAKPATGTDVSEPQAGFFRHRLVSGGVRGGVRIWFGPPHDPLTGEEMDRSWRWQAEFDGEYVHFDRVWPACTGDPIDEAEYEEFCARKRWAEKEAPNSAYAKRNRKRDPLSLQEPLPF